MIISTSEDAFELTIPASFASYLKNTFKTIFRDAKKHVKTWEEAKVKCEIPGRIKHCNEIIGNFERIALNAYLLEKNCDEIIENGYGTLDFSRLIKCQTEANALVLNWFVTSNPLGVFRT